MGSYRIFYSWQSDLDQKRNRYFLASVLEVALKELEQKHGTVGYLDQDTRGESGSPSISDVILGKIGAADIFVADVSLVASSDKRHFPNPNVLFELGYAVGMLGWDRTLLLFNEAHGDTRDLPFDIGHKRLVKFKYGPDDTKPPLSLRNHIRGIVDTDGEIRWTTDERKDAAAADPSAFITRMPNRLTWKPGGLDFEILTSPGFVYFAFPTKLGKSSVAFNGLVGGTSEIMTGVDVENRFGRNVPYAIVRSDNLLAVSSWMIGLKFF